ncbi:MAG: arsenate reductase ArsC [Aquificae bacterium]|nr:arsenate reductase ArsC [Aquificota bacterium]
MKNLAFICTGNSARSQIAEAIAKHIAKQKSLDIQVYSAGSKPAGYIHPLAKKVLDEAGIDYTGQYSKHLNELPDTIDIAVILCQEAERDCPLIPAKRVVKWIFKDPADGGIDDFRAVRDSLYKRISQLLTQL